LVGYLTSRPNIAIDAVDTDGYTALVLAVELDGEAATVGLNMAKVLLLAGANPNVMTFRRKTALRIACSKQDVTMVGRHC
jgi:ankyrin repeat protein